MKRCIEIFDSTLRDGAQSVGIYFSVDDKLGIVRRLDALGVAYVEAGNPASNPKDLEFFERAQKLTLTHTRLVAFGSTRHRGTAVEDDKNCTALIGAGTDTVAIFGKSWDLHVERVLHASLPENLSMIYDTVHYFTEHGREVFYDAEHFFDGYKANAAYALSTLHAALEAGASRLVLCDTNGGAFPQEISEITARVCAELPHAGIGVHCHNDMGCAVANSIAAVQAGAMHVQGTYLGFGERCGNANLSTVIPALQLRLGYTCIPPERMTGITHAARYIADVANYSIPGNMPIVGKCAFTHKGGMHVDGVSKLPESFETIPPQAVGNLRAVLLSEMAGRTAVADRLAALNPAITRDSPITAEVVEALKVLEHRGYQYESAAASMEILLLKKLGLYQAFFELVNYRIIGEQSVDERQAACAMIKVRVGKRTEVTAAEGDGPVHALDRALRKALEVFYPTLAETRLIDFKVRVVQQRAATASVVRVLIETTDGAAVWTTVGASADIIEASWLALVDSVEYKLLRDFREGRLDRMEIDADEI